MAHRFIVHHWQIGVGYTEGSRADLVQWRLGWWWVEVVMKVKLDIEDPMALLDYLRISGRIGADEAPETRVLGGGVSNRTVLVTRTNGEQWVLKQALEKLRVQVEWYAAPERIHREALGLRWLRTLLPRESIASFVFEDAEQHILAMAAVPQPHANWKTLLLQGQLERRHVEQFGRLLGTLHTASWHERADVGAAFDDRSFFEALRLEPYYAYAARQVPAAAPFVDRLIAETRGTRLALTHGDYSPKNILVHAGNLVLLDHEVIHFGDPAFDVGFSLTHLLSKAHHLQDRRPHFADAALLYWATYHGVIAALPWAANLQARAVRHTLACLLARVAGRSPLEYLTAGERAAQEAIVVALMALPPDTMAGLISQFIERLDSHAHH